MNTEAPIFKGLCLVLAIVLPCISLPWPASGSAPGLMGRRTAGEAASADGVLGAQAPALQSRGIYLAASQPDTSWGTGMALEEDEEDHLIRDISVFVIVSVFVAYFIIKVFLEGETEDIPADDGGKVVPDPFSIGITF